MDRNRAVPAAYVILLNEGEVLLGLRQNTRYQDGQWALPSGHVEAGELPWRAAEREAMEEIGIQTAPLHLMHVMYRTASDDTGDRVDFFFTSVWNKKEIINAEAHKCVEWRWFPLDALPEETSPHVAMAISCAINGPFYSELDADWFKRRGLYFLD